MSNNSINNIPYNFEINTLINILKSKNTKSVLVQLPNGLKHYFPYIYSELKKNIPRLRVYLSGHPTYGPCVIDEESARELGVDLIIHFGHLKYPYYTPKYNTIFIPAKSKLKINYQILLKLREILEVNSYRSIVLCSSAQHIDVLNYLASKLRSMGFTINVAEQPILGCYYSPALLYKADAYIVIAGGVFHAIGMWLSCQKPTIRIDPYEFEVEDISSTATNILKKRLWKMYTARDGRKWAIIDGMKGQSRMDIVEKLTKLLTKKGIEYIIVKADRIDEELLRNLGTKIDVYVITACPRIAIDDLNDFEKPVLTPGEAYCSLGIGKRYVFPW